MRLEYDHHVRAEGRQAANRWLEQQGSALGHYAGRMARAGTPCSP
ncbi:MAG: hypothetical protein QM682_16360 [Paracoccus sp. (in: a-proteobacteria)]